MKETKNTIEFEIPEGYELDKENSTAKKAVYKKVEKYEPQVGDLVYSGSKNGRQASIYLYEAYSPSIHRGFNSKRWNFSAGTIANVEVIRTATDKEAEFFTRILDQNGYEYDAEKKEVRKKIWRAEEGNPYWFVVIRFGGIISVDRLIDHRAFISNSYYNSGNYFRTKKEAEEVAAKFREILRKR